MAIEQEMDVFDRLAILHRPDRAVVDQRLGGCQRLGGAEMQFDGRTGDQHPVLRRHHHVTGGHARRDAVAGKPDRSQIRPGQQRRRQQPFPPHPAQGRGGAVAGDDPVAGPQTGDGPFAAWRQDVAVRGKADHLDFAEGDGRDDIATRRIQNVDRAGFGGFVVILVMDHERGVDGDAVDIAAIGVFAANDGVVAGRAIDQERVVAVLAVQRVVVGAAIYGIVIGPAKDDIDAATAVQGVIAGTARNRVCPVVPLDPVVSGAPPDKVVSGAANDAVIASFAFGRGRFTGQRTKGDDVIARTAIDIVVAWTAGDDVVPVAAGDHVIAGVALEAIIPGAAGQRVVAVIAMQRVISRPAGDGVITVLATDIDPARRGRAVKAVVAIGQVDLFDFGKIQFDRTILLHCTRFVARHRDRDRGTGIKQRKIELIDAPASLTANRDVPVQQIFEIQCVRARAAFEPVRPGAVEESVVASTPNDDVVAATAVDDEPV